MMMDKPPLHVAFNMSAAGSIRHALALRNQNERVIGFPDNLAFGPINPPAGAVRDQWIESVLHYENDGIGLMGDAFWLETTAPDVTPIVWVCRNDPAELCGFLEFVRRVGDEPFAIIDATEIESHQWNRVCGGARVPALGVLSPDQIVEAGLCDRRDVLTAAQIDAYRRQWTELVQENAPLRVMDGGGLASAALMHFDADIMACSKSDWQQAARVIGNAMVRVAEAAIPQYVSDLVLWARMRALADAGALMMEGLELSMRDCRVRLPVP